MKNSIARFVKDEFGATAIEYGLIAAGISLAIIAVVNGLGTNLSYQVQLGQHLAEVTQRLLATGIEGLGNPEAFFASGRPRVSTNSA